MVFLLLASAACSGRAVFPASAEAQGPPCPRSEVHALVARGRLFSALRLARAETLEPRRTRGARTGQLPGACADRAERDALSAWVFAELGACGEARSLTQRPLDCTPEASPVRDALARAAELRRSGHSADAGRLPARALHSYGGVLADGDFGDRVYSLRNAIFDYRGKLRAVLLARNASVLSAFADGTLEVLGPGGRQLYRCAIDEARLPAEDCADAFERPGQLQALVDAPQLGTTSLQRHAWRRRER